MRDQHHQKSIDSYLTHPPTSSESMNTTNNHHQNQNHQNHNTSTRNFSPIPLHIPSSTTATSSAHSPVPSFIHPHPHPHHHHHHHRSHSNRTPSNDSPSPYYSTTHHDGMRMTPPPSHSSSLLGQQQQQQPHGYSRLFSSNNNKNNNSATSPPSPPPTRPLSPHSLLLSPSVPYHPTSPSPPIISHQSMNNRTHHQHVTNYFPSPPPSLSSLSSSSAHAQPPTTNTSRPSSSSSMNTMMQPSSYLLPTATAAALTSIASPAPAPRGTSVFGIPNNNNNNNNNNNSNQSTNSRSHSSDSGSSMRNASATMYEVTSPDYFFRPLPVQQQALASSTTSPAAAQSPFLIPLHSYIPPSSLYHPLNNTPQPQQAFRSSPFSPFATTTPNNQSTTTNNNMNAFGGSSTPSSMQQQQNNMMHAWARNTPLNTYLPSSSYPLPPPPPPPPQHQQQQLYSFNNAMMNNNNNNNCSGAMMMMNNPFHSNNGNAFVGGTTDHHHDASGGAFGGGSLFSSKVNSSKIVTCRNDVSLVEMAKKTLGLADMLDPIFETIEFLYVFRFKSSENSEVKRKFNNYCPTLVQFEVAERVHRLISMNDSYYCVTLDLFKNDFSHPMNFKNTDLVSFMLNYKDCSYLLPKMNSRLEKASTRHSKGTNTSAPLFLGSSVITHGTNMLLMITKKKMDGLLVVRLAKRRSIGDLVQIVKNRPPIKEQKLDPSAVDDDLIQEQEMVPLYDPLTLCRIITPAKGTKCVHHVCFDLSSFLEYTKNSRSWLCPCCQTYLPFSELVVDHTMARVLADPKAHRFNKVIIRSNDEFEFLQPLDDDSSSDSDSDTDNQDLDLNAGPSNDSPKRKKPKLTSSKNTDIEVIEID